MGFADKALARIKRAVRESKPSPEITEARNPRDARTDEVHVYNALWGIPPKLSGMPNSALQRINTFLDHGRPKSMTILTFDPNTEPAETKQRLLDTGRIRPEVALVNLWHDLRGLSDEELATFDGTEVVEPVPAADGQREEQAPTHIVFRDEDTGKVIRRHHYRADGTLLVTDLCDASTARRVILHDHSETPLIEWDQARHLYNQWVERAVTPEPSLVIVDDKRIGEFIHELTPRRFKLALFVHGTHLKDASAGNYGQYLPQRAETMRNLESFDLVAVQSQQQIDAIAALGIGVKKIRLLPSAVPDSAYPNLDNTERSESAGTVVANLSKLKRVDHAIIALHHVRQTGHQATLTVCGTGPERDTLATLISERNLEGAVSLAGQVTNVPERLARSSFSTLTSTTEGLSLAVIESMAAGCIPIAYDTKYGPRDIITHGVNGYIVDYGNPHALAEQISEFLSLDETTKKGMREAAVVRARDFDSEHAYARWKAALEEPVKVHDPKPFKSPNYVRVRTLAITPGKDAVQLAIVFADDEKIDNKNLRLVLKDRASNYFAQAFSTPEGWQRTDDRTVYNFSIPYAVFSQSAGRKFDVHVRKIGAAWEAKARLKLPSTIDAIEANGLSWFRTEYGNFSVKCLAEANE